MKIVKIETDKQCFFLLKLMDLIQHDDLEDEHEEDDLLLSC